MNLFTTFINNIEIIFFNVAKKDIFGAETNTIGAEKDKFGAETDEFIFFKYMFLN